MDIISGLFERMVLQRDAKDRSDVTVVGTANADGALVARVMKTGKVAGGFDGKRKLGSVKGGRFRARLAGEHDLLIAWGTNQNRAWGILARFERKDVPARLRKLGAGELPDARVRAGLMRAKSFAACGLAPDAGCTAKP